MGILISTVMGWGCLRNVRHRVRLKLAYGMVLTKPALLFKRPTRIHSHEKTATAAVKLVSVF
jgi:hypothetical protein